MICISTLRLWAIIIVLLMWGLAKAAHCDQTVDVMFLVLTAAAVAANIIESANRYRGHNGR